MCSLFGHVLSFLMVPGVESKICESRIVFPFHKIARK